LAAALLAVAAVTIFYGLTSGGCGLSGVCQAHGGRSRLFGLAVAGVLAIGIGIGVNRAVSGTPARAALWVTIAIVTVELLLVAWSWAQMD
jgi:hypothetical protein